MLIQVVLNRYFRGTYDDNRLFQRLHFRSEHE
jgi:hypothetical protein